MIKAAEAWLKAATDDIRNERLAPLAEQARTIWRMLRQESNVDLGAIRLAGSATQRHVELDVSVDGTPGSALGVMSQGEVNALALSVFLPRATLPASPFRFLVIDDPVQAMDPAKVDGLARVLESTASGRQVIVFTHDNRLAQAVRQLSIPASILEVTRRPDSAVQVRTCLDPAEQASPQRRGRGTHDAVARVEVQGSAGPRRIGRQRVARRAGRRGRRPAGGDGSLASVPQGQGDGLVEGQDPLGRVRDVLGDVMFGADDLVPQGFDQRHGQAGGHRRHQPDPQRRQPRRQHRHRHDDPRRSSATPIRSRTPC
jgi:hypothetical protein